MGYRSTLEIVSSFASYPFSTKEIIVWQSFNKNHEEREKKKEWGLFWCTAIDSGEWGNIRLLGGGPRSLCSPLLPLCHFLPQQEAAPILLVKILPFWHPLIIFISYAAQPIWTLQPGRIQAAEKNDSKVFNRSILWGDPVFRIWLGISTTSH